MSSINAERSLHSTEKQMGLPLLELFSVSLEDGPESEKKRGHKGQAHAKSAPNLHNHRTEVDGMYL